MVAMDSASDRMHIIPLARDGMHNLWETQSDIWLCSIFGISADAPFARNHLLDFGRVLCLHFVLQGHVDLHQLHML